MSASERRPHLLYTAWGYPPSRGSGVYRAWATANAFAEAGWQVTVLTVPRQFFETTTGIDVTLEAQVHPDIRTVRVPFESPAFVNDLADWSWLRANSPELWNGLNARRGQRDFPERNYGVWRPVLEEAARRIHRETPVDLAIGTANPNVDFIPGHVLSTEHGIPAVMDHRDAWSVDIYSGRRTIEPRSRAGKWERRLMAEAAQVWFVNEPLREWHAQQHPDLAARFQVVENGYDVDLDLPAAGPTPRRSLTFGYIGTISGAIPLRELVDGWELARRRDELVRASRIDLYGYLNHLGVPGQNMVEAMERFERNGIRYHGPVGRAEISDTYAGFDALLLAFGSGRFITGGKVYEYASTGLPIVSVHDPANETTRTLADYPGWHGASAMTPDAIADAFIATAAAARDQTEDQRRQARAYARRYSRHAQLAPRISELQELVAHRRKESES